jgi:putative DNA primase/helicase
MRAPQHLRAGSAVVTPAERIANVLGNARREARGWRCICPVHGGHSLVVSDGRERRLLVKCWAGCASRDVLAELRRRGLIDGDAGGIDACPDPAERQRRRKVEARERQRRIANALDLWGECYPAPGTLVERYWRSRGLTIPVPPTIRMHGMMFHPESGARRPAMVALVEHVEYGPVGVHVTYLAVDGSIQATVEPRKRSLGPVGGGATRLAHVAPDRELVIAEGIETTASIILATGLPGWAALSAVGLRNLVLLPEARKVLIAADNDANGTGEKAARDAADRWLSEGRRVRIAMPPERETDFNDMLSGKSEARAMEADNAA